MTENISAQTVEKPVVGNNTWLVLVKLITGPLLIILLGIHFIVNHYIGQNGLLTYADVVAYYRNPIIPIMEICFLAAVVTHSLIGLRSILLDLKPSQGLVKVMNWVFLIGGVSAVAYGIWLVTVIVSRG